MTSRLALLLLAATALTTGCSPADTQEAVAVPPPPVFSQRGETPVADNAPAPEMASYPSKGTAIARDFKNQPPLIPHKPDYPITAKRNTCQGCHAIDAKMDVQVTHSSHYLADGTLNGAYYFCNECHVAQADAVEPGGNHFAAPGYPQ